MNSASFQKSNVINNKGKKFRPKKIPRYLPGSVQIDIVKSDLKEYNKHLFKVFTATPKVDATPPKFHFDKYMGTSNLEGEMHALKQIEKANQKILQKINLINRTQGKIDTFNHYANNHSSKWGLKLKYFESINKTNRELYKILLDAEPTYSKAEHDEFWKNMMDKMVHFSKYPLVILDKTTKDQILRQCPSISKNIEIDPTSVATRPKCFLEFKIDNGIVIGTVIVELYSDIVPNTVEHFLKLVTAKKKSLKNCSIPKIVINRYCIAGDPSNYNGKGPKTETENFNLQHTRPGVLSMIATGEKNTEISSQFVITFSEMSEFDDKSVVFGKIIKGALILFKVNQFGTWHGKPVTKIVISDCGIYERKVEKKKPTLKK